MASEFRLSYTASDINEKLGKIDSLANKSEIPSKLSELANDISFATESYVNTAVENIEAPEQVQADWNQNDEASVDYIKNRPFYSYSIEPIICDGTFVYETLSTGKIGVYLPDNFSLSESLYYNFTINDSVLNTKCGTNGITGYINRVEMGFVYIESDNKWVFYYGDGVVGENVYLKVEDSRGDTVYKTIGIEYMPEGLGTFGSGENSWAFNHKNNIASGDNSHAEGYGTTASGFNSHAEGSGTTASGNISHAEGATSTASGNYSHAEGSITTASGTYSHSEGLRTIAASSSQHAQGKWNIEDASNTYAHIVGNGSLSARSNAHTLDWSGNAWYQGDVYVGSSSGVDRDSGSKKLATEEYVNSTVSSSIDTTLSIANTAADAKAVGDAIANKIEVPVAAQVGQTIVVKAVDENGKPTEWEPMTLATETWTFQLADGTVVTKEVYVKS